MSTGTLSFNRHHLTDDQKEVAEKRKEELQIFLEPPYFRLPLMSIPVIRGGELIATLHLRLEMKAFDNDSFSRAKVMIYQIIDAIYTDLYGAFSNLWIKRTEPDPNVIRDRIFFCVNKVMGGKHIEAVFLKEFFFTRSNAIDMNSAEKNK